MPSISSAASECGLQSTPSILASVQGLLAYELSVTRPPGSRETLGMHTIDARTRILL